MMLALDFSSAFDGYDVFDKIVSLQADYVTIVEFMYIVLFRIVLL